MNLVRPLACIAAFAVLSGCATRGAGYVPLVDMKGKTDQQFTADLGECQQYALKRADEASGAVAGAVAMGLLGALLAPRGYRNEVAGRTAAIGAVGGAGQAMETREVIIKRCLAGRGYNVLN